MSYNLRDCAAVIRDELSGYDFSEKELNEIEERLFHLNMLKRKYGAALKTCLSFGKREK